MKTNILRTVCALATLSAGAALASTSSYEAPLSDEDQLSIACVDVDFAYMTDLDGNLTVDNLYGGTISLAYTFNATKSAYHKLGFSVGVLYGKSKETNRRLLLSEEEFNNAWIFPETGDFGPAAELGYVRSDYRYDIHDKFTQQVIPLILKYSYHRAVTSDLFVSAGVRAGVMISKTTMERTYVTAGSMWPVYTGSPSGVEDLKIQENHLRVAPVVGVGIGAEYKISDNWTWSVGADFDFSKSLLRERNDVEVTRYGSQVETTDVITTTIHTGFSYSF